jgi:hypothetical protein
MESQRIWGRKPDTDLDTRMSSPGKCKQSAIENPGYTSHLKRLSQVENLLRNSCSSLG